MNPITFTRLEFVLLLVASANVAIIIELVRRRHLREKYALLWLGVGLSGIVLSVTRGVVDGVARSIGIAYGPTVVFAGAILFLVLVCMHLSTAVSKLEERTTRLATELALIRGAESAADRTLEPDVVLVLDEEPAPDGHR
jgi:hypothetical protein